MVLADSHRISPVPRYSGYWSRNKIFCLRDYHSLWCNFPDTSTSILQPEDQSYNHPTAVAIGFWAIPFSLATTWGIVITFFSSRYLDVSVPWVSFPASRNDTSSMCRVVPFGYLRIKSYLHFPAAFRSLSRPSSPLGAKASAIRSYLLSIFEIVVI